MLSLPVVCRRFIGRHEQLDLMKARWNSAREGHGSTILIAGDAGLGKSRLVREFVTSTSAGSGLTAIGECLEYAPAPFAPFVDTMRAFIRARPDALREALAARRILSRLFPEFSVADAPPPEVHGRQQFDAYVEALRRLLGSTGGIIAIEDVHSADEGTLGLLLHIVGAVVDLPMLLVVTYRSDELERNHSLAPVLAKICRKAHVFQTRLEPLADDEMDEWLGEVASDHPQLVREVLQHTHRLAEGNPLFAEEMIAHAIAGGGAQPPLAIRMAVLERLSSLSEDDRLVLVVAAVAGDRFEPEVIAQTLGRSVPEVLLVLRRARDLRLVAESEHSDGLRFRHAMLREILYRELLAPEARALHARIAEAMERRPDAAAHPIELAHHFWEARNASAAARYAEAAGDAANRVGAVEDAARYYERALDVRDGNADEQARLYEKLGMALDKAGLAERALRAHGQALTYCLALGDEAQAANVYANIAHLQSYLGEFESSAATCERGLDLIRSSPESPVRHRLLYQLAHVRLLQSDLSAALHSVDEALEYAATAEPAVRAQLLGLRSVVLAYIGDFALAHEAARDAISAAENANDAHAIVSALNSSGFVHSNAGDELTGAHIFLKSARLAAESFFAVDEARGLLSGVMCLFGAGDIAGATRVVTRALAAFRRIDVPILRFSARYLELSTALRVDGSALVDHFADESTLDDVLDFGTPLLILLGGVFAEGFGRLGRIEEARAVYARALDTLDIPTVEIDSLVIAAQFGALDDLRRFRDRIASWASTQPTSRGRGFMAYLDACISQATGDRAAAIDHALEAARLFAQSKHAFLEALALEFAGKLREALEIYRRIGSTRDASRVDAMLAGKGRRGRSTIDLTERELEVVRLVAIGKPNKAIASALSISERTVENHVGSALKKFGAATRTELAAKLNLKEV